MVGRGRWDVLGGDGWLVGLWVGVSRCSARCVEQLLTITARAISLRRVLNAARKVGSLRRSPWVPKDWGTPYFSRWIEVSR
jgi:hypothetical protein